MGSQCLTFADRWAKLKVTQNGAMTRVNSLPYKTSQTLKIPLHLSERGSV